VAGDDPYFLTFMSEWAHQGASTPFAQSWMLAIEEKYYRIWPILLRVLMLVLLRARLAAVAMLGLLPILTLPLGLTVAPGGSLHGVRSNPDRLPARILLHESRIYDRLRFLGRQSYLALIAVLFVASLLLVRAWAGNVSLYAFPFIGGLLLITVVVGDGVSARVLSHAGSDAWGTRAHCLPHNIANRGTGHLGRAPGDWPRTVLAGSR